MFFLLIVRLSCILENKSIYYINIKIGFLISGACSSDTCALNECASDSIFYSININFISTRWTHFIRIQYLKIACRKTETCKLTKLQSKFNKNKLTRVTDQQCVKKHISRREDGVGQRSPRVVERGKVIAKRGWKYPPE